QLYESASSHGALETSLSSKHESLDLQHAPATSFVPGEPLPIVIAVLRSTGQPLTIRLYYRHVNQAERYEAAEMGGNGRHFSAVIPANYTNSKYPLQYYFELRRMAESAWLFPGFGRKFENQPYFVVRPTPRTGSIRGAGSH